MTDEQTFEKLYGMRMNGIASALREQLASPQSVDGLTFTDRLAMLVDREWNERENRSLTRRLALEFPRFRGQFVTIELRPSLAPSSRS
ncbi:MAG TPA: hypothetical protein VEC57_03150 [Candidatus Limnocylindrales bacterium]|nr:hypothetical protein [Candidatus Limnocylindrales bacterium]